MAAVSLGHVTASNCKQRRSINRFIPDYAAEGITGSFNTYPINSTTALARRRNPSITVALSCWNESAQENAQVERCQSSALSPRRCSSLVKCKPTRNLKDRDDNLVWTDMSKKSFHKMENNIPCRPLQSILVGRPRAKRPASPSSATTSFTASTKFLFINTVLFTRNAKLQLILR